MLTLQMEQPSTGTKAEVMGSISIEASFFNRFNVSKTLARNLNMGTYHQGTVSRETKIVQPHLTDQFVKWMLHH